MADPIDEDVPKLPRGRGIRLSMPQLVRILGLIAVLVVLLVMQKPCSNAVSTFVTGFDGSAAKHGSGSAAGAGSAGSGSGAGSAAPGLDHYEHLRPDMTDAEIKATIERAKLKAGSATAGSAAPGSAAPGSAAPVARPPGSATPGSATAAPTAPSR